MIHGYFFVFVCFSYVCIWFVSWRVVFLMVLLCLMFLWPIVCSFFGKYICWFRVFDVVWFLSGARPIGRARFR